MTSVGAAPSGAPRTWRERLMPDPNVARPTNLREMFDSWNGPARDHVRAFAGTGAPAAAAGAVHAPPAVAAPSVEGAVRELPAAVVPMTGSTPSNPIYQGLLAQSLISEGRLAAPSAPAATIEQATSELSQVEAALSDRFGQIAAMDPDTRAAALATAIDVRAAAGGGEDVTAILTRALLQGAPEQTVAALDTAIEVVAPAIDRSGFTGASFFRKLQTVQTPAWNPIWQPLMGADEAIRKAAAAVR